MVIFIAARGFMIMLPCNFFSTVYIDIYVYMCFKRSTEQLNQLC